MKLDLENANITYYFTEEEFWNLPDTHHRELEPVSVADIIGSVVETFSQGPTRWPIRNREERTPIERAKRAAIHKRDGGVCVYCEGSSELTVDHIIPRSAFRIEDLAIADRSDNLISACWPCNEDKSNFYALTRKRKGVTRYCGRCYIGIEYDDEAPAWGEVFYGKPQIPVFCYRCGHSGAVPSLEWVL